jgi:hypothetical protein
VRQRVLVNDEFVSVEVKRGLNEGASIGFRLAIDRCNQNARRTVTHSPAPGRDALAALVFTRSPALTEREASLGGGSEPCQRMFRVGAIPAGTPKRRTGAALRQARRGAGKPTGRFPDRPVTRSDIGQWPTR